MSHKFLFALITFIALLTGPAHAEDHSIVRYECNTDTDTLSVHTYISDKSAWEWQSPRDDLPFEWLADKGRPLQCTFSTGDSVLVKPYYGDYQKVAVYINGQGQEPIMVFDTNVSETFHIKGGEDHRFTVTYKTEIGANPAK